MVLHPLVSGPTEESELHKGNSDGPFGKLLVLIRWSFFVGHIAGYNQRYTSAVKLCRVLITPFEIQEAVECTVGDLSGDEDCFNAAIFGILRLGCS